jgi:hypothetical protein
MDLRLTDIEANAVLHALRKYLSGLDESSADKGVKYEADAVKSVIEKMAGASGASGT